MSEAKQLRNKSFTEIRFFVQTREIQKKAEKQSSKEHMIDFVFNQQKEQKQKSKGVKQQVYYYYSKFIYTQKYPLFFLNELQNEKKAKKQVIQLSIRV